MCDILKMEHFFIVCFRLLCIFSSSLQLENISDEEELTTERNIIEISDDDSDVESVMVR